MQANAKEREEEPAVWGPHVAECVMRGARLQWPYAGSCSFLWDICELFQHYVWVPWVSPFPEVNVAPNNNLHLPCLLSVPSVPLLRCLWLRACPLDCRFAQNTLALSACAFLFLCGDCSRSLWPLATDINCSQHIVKQILQLCCKAAALHSNEVHVRDVHSATDHLTTDTC